MVFDFEVETETDRVSGPLSSHCLYYFLSIRRFILVWIRQMVRAFGNSAGACSKTMAMT